jgi:hypothetical protein
MNNMKSRSILLFILILPTFFVKGQQWTDPINISNQGGQSTVTPNICIDNSGKLHCVWMHNIYDDKWRIYYSNSSNDGDTWSYPLDISGNDTVMDARPYIISDSDNNLYVIFLTNCQNPSLQAIYYRKFDGTAWSNPQNISEGYPGCSSPKFIIDHNNRVYCFWAYTIIHWTIFYRYLENGIWSDVYFAYNDTDKNIFLDGLTCDRNNTLQCVGGYYNYQPPHDYGIIYFQYFPSSNQWSSIEYITPPTDRIGQDIATDTNNYPHIAWGQHTNGSITYNEDSTMYCFKNSSGFWSNPEVVTPVGKEQQVIIDKYNKPNIIECERTDSGVKLVHFYKFSDQWIGNIIFETNCGVGFPNLLTSSDKLYLVFIQCVEGDVDILFSKCDVIAGIEKQEDLPTFSIFPNPSNSSMEMDFSLKYTDHIIISMYSSEGKLVDCIAQSEFQPGTYKILWKNESIEGNRTKLPPGLYFVRLQSGKTFITKSVIIC